MKQQSGGSVGIDPPLPPHFPPRNTVFLFLKREAARTGWTTPWNVFTGMPGWEKPRKCPAASKHFLWPLRCLTITCTFITALLCHSPLPSGALYESLSFFMIEHCVLFCFIPPDNEPLTTPFRSSKWSGHLIIHNGHVWPQLWNTDLPSLKELSNATLFKKRGLNLGMATLPPLFCASPNLGNEPKWLADHCLWPDLHFFNPLLNVWRKQSHFCARTLIHVVWVKWLATEKGVNGVWPTLSPTLKGIFQCWKLFLGKVSLAPPPLF